MAALVIGQPASEVDRLKEEQGPPAPALPFCFVQCLSVLSWAA